MNWIDQVILKAEEKGIFLKYWDKKGQRLYITSDFLYNTNKMKTTAYIDLETFAVICQINCPSQDGNYKWLGTQKRRVYDKFDKWARYARLMQYFSQK